MLKILQLFPLHFLFTTALLILLGGCYPMPKEGQYSTIPMTNNPDVVGSYNTGAVPGGSF